jgi:hypothetical protein
LRQLSFVIKRCKSRGQNHLFSIRLSNLRFLNRLGYVVTKTRYRFSLRENRARARPRSLTRFARSNHACSACATVFVNNISSPLLRANPFLLSDIMEPKVQIYEASERKAGTGAKRNSGRLPEASE